MIVASSTHRHRTRSFESIRKLPSGKYQARYWHLGKQIAAEHTSAAKTDARCWLSTVEADIVRGDWVGPTRTVPALVDGPVRGRTPLSVATIATTRAVPGSSTPRVSAWQ